MVRLEGLKPLFVAVATCAECRTGIADAFALRIQITLEELVKEST
jgi:hypothetical protein